MLFVYNKSFNNLLEIYIFDNLSNWNVLSIFRDGYPDEIIYSIILGLNNLKNDNYIHDLILIIVILLINKIKYNNINILNYYINVREKYFFVMATRMG